MSEKVVIIGGSITGTFTTTALFRNGFEGKVTLIDENEVYPYNPYKLSKSWMMDRDEENPPLLKDREYYDEHNIDLKLNTKVDSVDAENKTVTTDRGETIPYDHLVIASGSKLRKLSFPGDDANGIFYLRYFSDAKEIKDWAKDAKDVAIIGSGFIGLELVSTFNQLDKNVSVLVRSGKPLDNVLGEDVADYFIDMHQSNGGNFMFGEEAEEFIKDEDGNVTSIRTKNGKTLDTDMVIIAVGVKPNLSFDIDSLEMEDGIVVVDEYGETSLPDVYAGGDIAKWPYKDRMIHVEHWEIAWSQGISIAKNIIDKRSNEYDVIPYFWTDQYDQSFEYLGNATDWDETFVRGSIEDGEFSIAYVDEDNRPLAILYANGFEERDDLEDLLDKEEPIEESKFTDVNIPIKEM